MKKLFLVLAFVSLLHPISSHAQGQNEFGFSEFFDDAVNIPSTWSTVNIVGSESPTIVTAVSDTPSNSLKLSSPESISDTAVATPPIVFSTQEPTYKMFVSFRHKRGMENNFDIGVLEVSINSGPFVDFKDPSFSTAIDSGDYNGNASGTNPIAGRAGWTGTSDNFETVRFTLSSIPSGAQVRLRFRFTSDISVPGTGWFIDTVVISPFVDSRLEVTADQTSVVAGGIATYTVKASNAGSVSINPEFVIVSTSDYTIESVDDQNPGSSALRLGRSIFFSSATEPVPAFSTKSFSVKVKTSIPPQGSAVLRIIPLSNSGINDAVVGAAFTSNSPGAPIGGFDKLPVVTLPLDYCSPIPAPVPPSLLNALAVSLSPLSCKVGTAALHAQEAGALAFLAVSSSTGSSPDLVFPYVKELPTPGLFITAMTTDLDFSASAVDLLTTPGTKVTITGSNNTAQSSSVLSVFMGLGTSSDPALGNNNASASVDVSQDSDSDGTSDLDDLCPIDPLKVASGGCGCGFPDDANQNGVFDCLGAEDLLRTQQITTNTFRTKVTDLKTKLRKLKKDTFSKQKSLRNSIGSIVKSVKSEATKGTNLLVKPRKNIRRLSTNLKDAVTPFIASTNNFTDNRKASLKALDTLLSALAG